MRIAAALILTLASSVALAADPLVDDLKELPSGFQGDSADSRDWVRNTTYSDVSAFSRGMDANRSAEKPFDSSFESEITSPELRGISTRGEVGTGDKILIGGFR